MYASRRLRSRPGLPRGADLLQTETGPSPAQAERPLAGDVKARGWTADNGTQGKMRTPQKPERTEPRENAQLSAKPSDGHGALLLRDGFGVALWELCGSLGVALGCLSIGYQQALWWLSGRFGWLGWIQEGFHAPRMNWWSSLELAVWPFGKQPDRHAFRLGCTPHSGNTRWPVLLRSVCDEVTSSTE